MNPLKLLKMKNSSLNQLRSSIKIGVSGIVYDSAPPLRVNFKNFQHKFIIKLKRFCL